MNHLDVKARVDNLLAMPSRQSSVTLQITLYQGTLGVMQALYGPDSSQENDLRAYLERLVAKVTPTVPGVVAHCIEAIRGSLESIKAELDAGFIGSLRATLTGEVIADLIRLARRALEETGEGAKNVAAVLAGAAFEDTVRKISDLKRLPDCEKLMGVITALKEVQELQGAEVGIAQSYLKFRNEALHANWDAVSRPGVESVLGFTEQMILKHLT